MSGPAPGYRYRNLVWPVALIALGVLALLVNTNVIPADRLYRLADLWPLILVVIGLEMLVRRVPMPAAATTAAAALILLLAAGGAIAYVATGPALGNGTLDSNGKIAGLHAASLEVDAGGAAITVRGDATLGDELYRAHITYAGRTPSVSLDSPSGELRISQNGSGLLFPSQRLTLDLRINTAVPWSIAINAGGTTDSLNLATVTISSIAINAGGSTANITLGAPHGSVPITVNGGGLNIHLHRPRGTAASVRVSGGAANLTFDGRHHAGIGSAQDSSGSGSDVYEVEVSGGGCTVTMDTNTTLQTD